MKCYSVIVETSVIKNITLSVQNANGTLRLKKEEAKALTTIELHIELVCALDDVFKHILCTLKAIAYAKWIKCHC